RRAGPLCPWTQAEVSRLLSLVWGSGEAALLMASTSRPNEALWREISRGLAAVGYGRTVAQCRSKWKALKQEHIAGVPPTAPAMPRKAFLALLSPVNPSAPQAGSDMVLIADTGCCFSPVSLLGEYHAPATMLVCPGARGGCSSQAVSALLPGCPTDLKQEGSEGKASKCLQL
uniref:Uncharacterized protein n=1 Tax=Geospiza parvula TaxID=87175 RepID=A0A8C3N546_GEOPR